MSDTGTGSVDTDSGDTGGKPPQKRRPDRTPRGTFAKGNEAGVATRFKKGVPPANPGGRPRRADSILSQLTDLVTETKAQKIARRLIRMAETAEGPQALAAIREILDRLDGTVARRLEVTGEITKTVILSRPEDGPHAGLTIDAKPVPVLETRTPADAARDSIIMRDKLPLEEPKEPKRPGVAGFVPVPAPGLKFNVPTVEELQRRAENGE